MTEKHISLRRVEIIVNPVAGGGRTLTIWQDIEKQIKKLGIDYSPIFTQGVGDATELAKAKNGVRINFAKNGVRINFEKINLTPFQMTPFQTPFHKKYQKELAKKKKKEEKKQSKLDKKNIEAKGHLALSDGKCAASAADSEQASNE